MAQSFLIDTIGYEGLPQQDLLNLLRQAGVQRVADIRAIANSRRPGYAKRALSAALAGAGIGYLHLPALGTPATGRAANRAGRMGEFRRIFAEHLAGTEAQAALAMLAHTSRETRTCLLCLEADPAQCHRTIVAEAMKDGWGFQVRHLHAPAA
jgi:uncharacterized protein (DUF488 family)